MKPFYFFIIISIKIQYNKKVKNNIKKALNSHYKYIKSVHVRLNRRKKR